MTRRLSRRIAGHLVGERDRAPAPHRAAAPGRQLRWYLLFYNHDRLHSELGYQYASLTISLERRERTATLSML